MQDLSRAWRKWTETKRFSAVIILAATIAVILPAAIEAGQHSGTPITVAQR